MDLSALADKLESLPPVRCLVVGDYITDVDVHGRYTRFAQEAPDCPVFLQEKREERDGGAGAVLAMVDALSHPRSLSVWNRPSRKTRHFVGGRQVWRHDEDAAPPTRADGEWLAERVEKYILCDNPHAVLVADYGKGVCTDAVLKACIEGAARRKIPCLVDPARGADWRRYAGCTAIKCNHAEREGGHAYDGVTRTLVVTNGAGGMTLLRTGKQQHFPARERAVVDTVGAGDMALACLGVCLGGGMGWEEACTVANHAAGLKVTRRGAVPVPRAEVIRDLARGECPRA